MKIHIQGSVDLKRRLIYIVLIVFVFMLTACNKRVTKTEETPVVQETVEKELSLNIVATDRLLYNMVKDIASDRHTVVYMFTTKDKLWSFNYTEDSLNNISRKDLFFYWGTGLEPWSGEFINKLSKNKVGAASVSRGVKLIQLQREIKYKDVSIKENPYFWINIDNYKIAMLNIKNTLQDKNTKDREIYEKNFSATIKEVEEYQKKLKEAADRIKDYTFIVDGDELDYFTEYYGLKTLKLYNYGIILTPKEVEENVKVEEKIKEAENVVFLYDDEGKIKSNEALINKYNLKTSNILVYKNNIRYIDILSNNLKTLESLSVVK
jgi:zinc/manganese transport system substrate-binding protein